MDRDDGFREQYCNKINDYLGKGYARVLTEAEALCEPKNTWYLPHFAGSNPNKPNKIRLVFDAAARSHGISLNDEANWRAQPQWMNVSSEHDAELKAEFCATQVAPKLSLCIPDAEQFSSYPKLLRSTAWVSRFIDNLKRKLAKQPRIEGELTADEIKRAEHLQCRKVQSDCFAQEIHDLQQGGQVSGASRLSQLALILDEKGII